MTKKKYKIFSTILILIGVILLFELIRDAFKSGDFIGYVNAGNLVLSNDNIYSDYLNTWPPLFSVFSVMLAVGDGISSCFIRFAWLLGSIVALFYILKISLRLIFQKELKLRGKDKGIILQDSLVIVPLLIMLRFIMDNFANIQINIYILLCALLCFVFFIQKKYIWLGLLLGLTISLKIYPIFILFYFIFKREWKPVAWTFIFIVSFNSISLLVFGFEQGIEYYKVWITEVAPKSYMANHKNQSVFGMFLRLFTNEDPTHNMYVNFLSLKPYTAKLLTYAAILLASIVPAFLFRKKLEDRFNLRSILEYSFILTAIPILSPVSWKAYFIFLWLPYFLLYALLYKSKPNLTPSILKLLKSLFWLSVILNVASTDLISGPYFSDVLEAYSAITIGSFILLLIQIAVYMNLDKFELKSIQFDIYPSEGNVIE